MARMLAAVLALFLAGNGLAMLAAPGSWYDAVPGVAETGPFNRHFVMDIGAAFLVAGIGSAWAAWRPGQGWPALVAGTAFVDFHALIHLAEAAGGHGAQALQRDFAGVFVPALLGLWLVFLLRPKGA